MKPKYWTIIILASAAIIASLLYYLRQPATYSGPVVFPHVTKVQPQATTTSQTDTIASTSPQSAQPQTNTSGWKTYTNSQYGFSFEYPVDWVLSVDTNGSVTVDFPGDDEGDNGITVSELSNQELKDLNSGVIVTSQESGLYNYNNWQVSIAKDDVGEEFYRAVFAKDFTNFVVSSFNSNDLVSIRDHLLSTFQFIVPASPIVSSSKTQAQADTNGWKTYTNSQYSFSFNHPVINLADYQPTASQEVNDYNASSTTLSFRNAFYIEIQENPGGLNLKDWFEKNIDDTGILLKDQNFKLINTSNNVQAMEVDNTSNFPDEYGGDEGIHFDQWYIETQDDKYIISYNFDYQDDTLGGYGIPNDDGNLLGEAILSSFKFTN